MSSRIIYLLLLIFVCIESPGQELNKQYQLIVSKFIDCVKHDKKVKIANMIYFPLEREYPIPSVKNNQEFIKRYNDIFDNKLKQLIINSKPATDWSEVGWRGIMLNDGDVWMNFEGHLISVPYQSESESKLRTKLIEREKKSIHPSLSNYEDPIYIIEKSQYRIRIDDLGNENYRYASWKIYKSQKEKPDLILEGGVYSPDGSGGNGGFTFKNAGYTYECFFIALKSETEHDPDAWLTVYKGDRIILTQRARIIYK